MLGICDIESHDVRIERAHQIQRFVAIAREPDIEVAFCQKYSLQQLAHQRGIVGDEKPDHDACGAGRDGDRSSVFNMSAST